MPCVCLSACGGERANLACLRAWVRLAPRRAPSTIARLRSGAAAWRSAPLRKAARLPGAFSATLARFAFSPPLRSSLRAAPWGHFASLVRSIAPQSARLPSESFAFFGAFTLIRRGPRCAMHPPLRCAWLGREASLRQSPPSRRRLPHRGGVFAPAPFLPRVRSPANRQCRFFTAQAFRLHLFCCALQQCGA